MSKKSGKEQYLDAKHVTDNPNKFDYRDVARAKEFCEGYEAGQVETPCYVPELKFKAIQLSTGKEIESDSISQKTICEKLHVFMKDPNRTDYGRVWTEVDPETVKQIS